MTPLLWHFSPVCVDLVECDVDINPPLQLISSVDPKFLKLTKMDDQIYKVFREGFKDYEIKVIKEEDLKSDKAKEVGASLRTCTVVTQTAVHVKSLRCFASQTWRAFCNQFEGVVEDFNYGTLLRLDCEEDYTEENSIFGTYASPRACFERLKLEQLTSVTRFLFSVTRIQFLAIEIARNREGYNSAVFRSKQAAASPDPVL